LSNNPNSPVRIYSQTYVSNDDYVWHEQATWNKSNYALSRVDLKVEDFVKYDYSVRLHSFRAVVGFNRRIGGSEVCSNEDNISSIMRKMTKALYRVTPGFPFKKGDRLNEKVVKFSNFSFLGKFIGRL